MLLQFLEDLSDRELERFICENNAARWFCGFDLTAKTPDHSVFGRVRSRIGTSKLSKIFSLLRDQLKAQGYMSEVFTFVDATHLISKVGLWKERDKAIELKLESLSNKTLEKVAFDKGYCDKNANKAALAKGVHLCAIKKNNMKGKNRDLDRYYTAIRAPFEHVFPNKIKESDTEGLPEISSLHSCRRLLLTSKD